MPALDLRHFLDLLRKNGELLAIHDEVDPCFEVSEYLRQFDKLNGPALIFENIKGRTGQIAGNLVGTQRRLALAFGQRDPGKLLEVYRRRRSHKISPKVVRTGPVKQVVAKSGKQVDLNRLPIPTYHEGDGGPYITCGIIIASDPLSGQRSMGLHRLHIKGPRRIGVHLSNPPISRFAAAAEKNGKSLDVAISLGVHPVILLASIISAPTGDKLAIASSLMGSPIALVRCETVNAVAPAHAEVVIEGKVLPDVREPEGPFGETSGYYFSDESHVIEVTAITQREKPIIQALHPTVREVTLLGGPAGEAELKQMLQEKGFPVADLLLGPYSNRSHVIVSVRKSHDAEPHQLLHFLLAAVPFIKHAVVLDDDIDIRDPGDVEWAIATRFQADQDLVVMPNMKARAIDRSKKAGGFMTKCGLDATVPLALRESFKRIMVPPQVRERVAKVIQQITAQASGKN
jgi:2,5-furandicarboxylate decarboxylase 1